MDNLSLLFGEVGDGSFGIIDHDHKDLFSIRFCPFCGTALPNSSYKVGEWVISTDIKWYSFDKRLDLAAFLKENDALPRHLRTIENFVKHYPQYLEEVNPQALHEVLQVCATSTDPEVSAFRLLASFECVGIIALAMLNQTTESVPSFRDIRFIKSKGKPFIRVETYLNSQATKELEALSEQMREKLFEAEKIDAEIESTRYGEEALPYTPEPVKRPPMSWTYKPDMDKLRQLPGFIDDFDQGTNVRVFRYAVPDPHRDSVLKFLSLRASRQEIGTRGH